MLRSSAGLALASKFAAGDETEAQANAADLVLWYDKPAKQWTDALPIGNGWLGAMVYGAGEDGSPTNEVLQLNEDTLWSGKPRDGNNRDASKYLPAIREAVLKHGNYEQADQVCRKMQGLFAEAYQPLGTLRIEFHHAGLVERYRRELNLDTACTRVTYGAAGVDFERVAFASAPDQMLVFRATASIPGELNCLIHLDSPLQISVTYPSSNQITLTGKAPAHVAGAGHPHSEQPVTHSDELGEGMYFAAIAQIRTDGGSLAAGPDGIHVKSASSVTILLTANTGYRGYQLTPDTPVESIIAKARQTLDQSATYSFDELRTRHVADHQELFRRVSFQLPAEL